jgi:hypothetical protein
LAANLQARMNLEYNLSAHLCLTKMQENLTEPLKFKKIGKLASYVTDVATK